MRNLGWMKAPDSFLIWDSGNLNGGGYIPARQSITTIRKIITRMYLSEGEHWIRFKDINPNNYKEEEAFSFDYIELVPLKIISDPSKPEDRH